MAKRLVLGMAGMTIVAVCRAGYGAPPEVAAVDRRATPVTRAYSMVANGKVDFPGNDITYWRGPFSGCPQACDSTPGCVAYVLHKDNGSNCWLKNQLGNPVSTPLRDTFQISRSLPVPAPPVPVRDTPTNGRRYTIVLGGNTDFPGNDIVYWKGPFSGCAPACDTTPGCVAYVLHKDNGSNCWLKTRLDRPVPSAVRDTFTTPLVQR